VEQQQQTLSPAQRLVNALRQVAEGFILIGTGVGELGSIVSEVHKGWSEARAARLRAVNANPPIDASVAGQDNLNRVPSRT
jgi:hypothetical protein